MMRSTTMIVAGLALAACGRDEPAPEANNAAAPATPVAAAQIEPGMYRQATTLLSTLR